MIEHALRLLERYISDEKYQGYDPYDTLNSWFPFKKYGTLFSAVAIQFQKLNPVNIRPLLGIKKGYNAKGMGLLLKSYSILHENGLDIDAIEKAEFIFKWLAENTSKQYNLPCWGYNFDWATPKQYLDAYTPSVVVTSFVVDGLWEYYKLTKNEQAKDLIIGASEWIIKEIPVSIFEEGVSFAYTAQSKGACYNASLLAAEVLAKADVLNKSSRNTDIINRAIDFVLSKQRENGSWLYSYDPQLDTERLQIDFHQGFVMISLKNINVLLPQPRSDVSRAISKGLEFYRNEQFLENGQSLWRIPKKWPIDIHNQSQGIITFSELCDENLEYLNFAQRIAEWTIRNMQSSKGYFYYRKYAWYTHKIPYMRWSQAWMLLALATLYREILKDNCG